MQRLYSQLGYNLVEMAIALVVLGLLLGGALIPLQVRYEQAEINSAEEYMEEAKAAILGFALQNSTVPRKFQAAHDNVVYNIPAGRPYLPCPDIDNDGVEDRNNLPSSSATLAAVSFATSNEGKCKEQKGALPWKTLGVKRLDSWGNHLTYRVDEAFSDAVLGFDEMTRADIFDRRQTLVFASDKPYYEYRTERGLAGGVVCEYTGTVTVCPGRNASNSLVGIFTNVALTLGARRVPAYNSTGTNAQSLGLVDGAVFVIVSHGRNGSGAINRSGNCRDIFLSGASGGAHASEIINAHYRSGHALVNGRNCIAGGGLYENLFVDIPISARSGDGVLKYDDMLMWAGTNEVLGFLLRGGKLPLGRLGFLPE